MIAAVLLAVAPRRGGGSGIGVDAQVTWYPAKPAGADVARADRVAVVSVVESVPSAQQREEHLPTARRVVVTDASTLAGLRAPADGLHAANPGVRSCPADLGTRYVVAFSRAVGTSPGRTFTAGSCGQVTVTDTAARTIATLSDDPESDSAHRGVLGLGSGAPRAVGKQRAHLPDRPTASLPRWTPW